jgi:predicted molibdopterin-dependent oxidoreductase YjgC
MSRPTVEINPKDAKKRGINDGDLCRIYNDRGETFAHAVIIEKLLPGVCNTQKQFKGSNTYGGVNVNALNTEMLTDFGNSPTFYSCLAEIELANDEVKKRILESWGGEKGFIKRWRADPRNKGIKATEKEILAAAKQAHPGVFE